MMGFMVSLNFWISKYQCATRVDGHTTAAHQQLMSHSTSHCAAHMTILATMPLKHQQPPINESQRFSNIRTQVRQLHICLPFLRGQPALLLMVKGKHADGL